MLLRELAKTTLECLGSDSPTSKAEEPASQDQPAPQPPAFDVIFRANAEGDLTISVGWPNPEVSAPSSTAQIMATMMHQISTGAWKGLMVKAIQNYGADVGQPETAQGILENWSSSVVEERGSALCVEPTAVFRGGNPHE